MADLTACFEAASTTYQRVQVASLGQGARKVRQVNTSRSPHTNEPEIRAWRVTARFTTQAEFEQFEQVWENTSGGVTFLSWVPPDEVSEINVRVDEYRCAYSAHGRFEVEMLLEEDF